MAKVWPVYEGRRPTYGEPWADLPLSDAISLFELQQHDFLSDLETTPRFGDVRRDLTWLGYKNIVVEIGPGEGRRAKWKAGFYRSRIKPKEAFRRLIEQPLVTALGRDNVIRVDYQPTADSLGQSALKITVILAPGALDRIADGAPLDALGKLRERLSQMRDDRTPIVEYATEAELAQDAGR